jgi:hypothetical protein
VANQEHLFSTHDPKLRTVQDLYLNNFKNYPQEEWLGHRPYIACPKNGLVRDSRFVWLKNCDYEKISRAIGSAMLKLGMAPALSEFRHYSLKLVAVASKNSYEWL